jgi:hypothetical protein
MVTSPPRSRPQPRSGDGARHESSAGDATGAGSASAVGGFSPDRTQTRSYDAVSSGQERQWSLVVLRLRQMPVRPEVATRDVLRQHRRTMRLTGMHWPTAVHGVLVSPGARLPKAVDNPQTRSHATLRLANLTNRRALGYGVTNELSSMARYRVPQQYAEVFDQTRGQRGGRRFHGIRYRTRFAPGPLGGR